LLNPFSHSGFTVKLPKCDLQQFTFSFRNAACPFALNIFASVLQICPIFCKRLISKRSNFSVRFFLRRLSYKSWKRSSHQSFLQAPVFGPRPREHRDPPRVCRSEVFVWPLRRACWASLLLGFAAFLSGMP